MVSFAERVTSPRVRKGFATAAATDGALRVTYALTDSRVWDWVQTVGVVSHEELASLLPPVPPLELRRIATGIDAVHFLWSGLLHAELIIGKYESHRLSNGRATVLDFGCGCGRLCRYLSLRPDLWTVHACEVNPAHVSWLEAHLPAVRPMLSPLDPPLSYQAGQFDLVYALSVFSHLPPQRAVSWLTELRRILKPGGLLIVTTQGVTAIERAANSDYHLRLLHLEERTIEAARVDMRDTGIIYTEYSTATTANPSESYRSYGSTVVSLDRLRQWAGTHLEIIQHDEGAVDAWQDVTVMQAR